MADSESRREMGGSAMFMGLAVWVVALLVVFFLPAGIRLGHQVGFFSIIAVLGVLGLILMVGGFVARGKPSAE